MYSKIIWRLNADRTITQVTKGTTKLYANSDASTEYGLIGANIGENDVVYLIANRNGEEFRHRLKRALITFKDGTTEMGWKAVTNEQELNFDLQQGSVQIGYSFNIKRFSLLDGVTLLSDLTSSTDIVNVYPGSSYHPELEPTEAEVILSDIAEIESKLIRGDLEAKGIKIWQETLIGNENPTITTIGELGQYYYNNANDTLFVLTSIEEDNYYWTQLADSGSRGYSKNVVVYDKNTKAFYISKENINLEDIVNISAWEKLEQQDIIDLVNSVTNLENTVSGFDSRITNAENNSIQAINTANNAKNIALQTASDINKKVDKQVNGTINNAKTFINNNGDDLELKAQTQTSNTQNYTNVNLDAYNVEISATNQYVSQGQIITAKKTLNITPSYATIDDEKVLVESDLDGINAKLGDCTEENPAADKAFVNSTIQTATANFRGNWEDFASVPADKDEYPLDYAQNRKPTVNDYIAVADAGDYHSEEIFTKEGETTGYYISANGTITANADFAYSAELELDEKDKALTLRATGISGRIFRIHCYDENHNWLKEVVSGQSTGELVLYGTLPEEARYVRVSYPQAANDIELYTHLTLGSWRFKYTGNWEIQGKAGWEPEYLLNETPFTMEQLATLNSGLTAEDKAKIGTAVQPNDLKTINGESIIGTGDIELQTKIEANNSQATTEKLETLEIDGINYQLGGGAEEDNVSITKNSEDKIQAVALKSKGKKVTTDGIVDGNFDGITHFESDEDFVTFVEQGYIEKGGVRLDYDPNGFYSTPSNEHLVGTSSENLVIDIGSSQLTLETDNKVYPKMTVANAKLIYDNYKSGRPFTIKWTLMGVSLYFTPVNATTMINSFVVVLHDKFIKYEWTNSQADGEELSPQYEAEQTWTHTINCNATTAQGQYKYQFQFRDADASKYNMLYEVAAHLMQEYEGIRIGASGTYTEGANVYLITSVEASSSSQIAVTMTKLSDGSERIITTGAVAISDSVHK